MKQVLGFNVMKRNSSDRLRSEQEDGCGHGCCCCCCCCCCCLDVLLCVSLGSSEGCVYWSPFSPPHPRMAAHPGREGGYLYPPLYPGSNQNLLAPHSRPKSSKSRSFNKSALKFDSYTSRCKTSNTFQLQRTKGSK